jgi:hypothetical protein
MFVTDKSGLIENAHGIAKSQNVAPELFGQSGHL